MAEDWLADVRKYVADADETVVKAIVRYCGIALQNRDSSLVAFSDSKETDRVRENYLKKKLGLSDSDDVLDAAIAAVGERMKEDRTKNRVTVYYLLAEHFGSLGVFGGKAGTSAASAPLAAAAATTAGLAATASAAPEPAPEPLRAAAMPAPAAAPPVAQERRLGPDEGIFGWGCGVAALVIGCFIVAALLAWWFMYRGDEPVATPVPVVTVTAPAPMAAEAAPAEAIPVGAGVTTGDRDGKPMLTVYFDTGKSDVTNDLAAAAAKVKKYIEDNPDAKLAVSGFNDPTGNAAANAELSKNRAQAVKAALEKAGIPKAAVGLVKPSETTDASGDNSAARRVEVTVQ